MPKVKKIKKELTEEEIKRQLEEARGKEKEVLNIQKEERQKRIQEFKSKKKGKHSRALLGCLLVVIIFILILAGWIFSLKNRLSKTSEEPSEFGQLFTNLKGNFSGVFSEFNQQMAELEELTQDQELTPAELEKLKAKILEEGPAVEKSQPDFSAQTKPAAEEAELLDASSWPVYYNNDGNYRLKYPAGWNKEILEAGGEVLSKTYFSSEDQDFKVSVYERSWFEKNLSQEKFVQETIRDQEALVSEDGSSYYLFNDDKLYLINFSTAFNDAVKDTILENFQYVSI